jgi:hypothetical protein
MQPLHRPSKRSQGRGFRDRRVRRVRARWVDPPDGAAVAWSRARRTHRRFGPSPSLPRMRRQRESDRLDQMGRPRAGTAMSLLSAAMPIRAAVNAAREAITAPTPVRPPIEPIRDHQRRFAPPSGRNRYLIEPPDIIVPDIPDAPINRVGVVNAVENRSHHVEQLIGGRLSLGKPPGPFSRAPGSGIPCGSLRKAHWAS